MMLPLTETKSIFEQGMRECHQSRIIKAEQSGDYFAMAWALLGVDKFELLCEAYHRNNGGVK